MSSNSEGLTDDELLFMHNQISCNWCGVTPDEPKGFAYWACDKNGREMTHEKEFYCMDCTKEIKIMHDGERVCPTCSFHDEFPWRNTPPLNPINMDLVAYFGGQNKFDAESLKKDSCCCGATKAHPCLCMIQGNMKCAAKSPMCPCYKEIAMGIKVEMEHTKSKEKAEKIAKEHLAEHPDYYSRLKSAGLDAENEDSCFRCGCKGDYDEGDEINLVYCELCDDYWCNDACREPSCWDRHYNYTCTRNAAETFGAESDDYLEGVEKGIPMGYCEGCSHAYPLEDMNEYGMCEECEGVLIADIDWETDDEDSEEMGLPSSVRVPSYLQEDEIADYLSDEYGFLVNGFVVMGAETFDAEEIIKGNNFYNLYSLSGKYHPEDSPYGDFYYFNHRDKKQKEKIKEQFHAKLGSPNNRSGKFDEMFDELLGAWIAIYPNLDNAEVITVGIEPDSKVKLNDVEDWLGLILADNRQYGAVPYPRTTIPENIPYSSHGYFPQFTIQKQDNRHDYFNNHEINLDFIDPLPSAKSNEVEADITLTMENGDLWKAFPVKFTRSGNRLGAETFESAVVSRSVPKTPVKKAMLNKAMMDKAEIEEAILDLETRVRLGLISEDEIMRKLHHRFGSEEEEFVSCPHCEGSGSIADPSTYLPATRYDPGDVDSMECPYCEGSGEVPEDEADEIPAYDWDDYRPNPDDRWDNYDRYEDRYDAEMITRTSYACSDCGREHQQKRSALECCFEGCFHNWELNRTKDWENGVFTMYVSCRKCGADSYIEGHADENSDSNPTPTFNAESENKAFMVAGIAVLSALSIGIYKRWKS